MKQDTLNRITSRSLPYEKLIIEFPPRVVRDKVTLDKTYEVIDTLMRIPDKSRAQLEFLDLLASLVELHEAQAHPTPVSMPSELLAHLIEAKGVSQAEVARSTGIGPSAISDVLAGRRSISFVNLFKLAEYFGVSYDTLSASRRAFDEARK